MADVDISTKTDDFDTLGGRLGRARIAKGISASQLAKQIGVDARTLHGWESDRSEPRSNRLSMLAGLLGVSPSWLLFGRGTSPQLETTANVIATIQAQLDQLKAFHQETTATIEAIEASLHLLAAENTG